MNMKLSGQMTLKINEENIKNLKNNNNLGRSERSKKATRIRKKLKCKKFRIRLGKDFVKTNEPLNKKDRRELLKDKDLIRELMKIIKKYFPQLMPLLSKLTDKRNKSYIKYNIRTIITTRLFALICGITTMTGINSNFSKEKAIKNLSEICDQELEEIPDWQTIQDVIEQLDIEEIKDIRKYLVKSLIRSKMFDKYRYNGAFQLLVDATGVSAHDYNLHGNCISRKRTDKKTGKEKIKYYKQVLEAKIVVSNIVISLDTEWIENSTINTEKQKQDCEINAFKRMAPRIKKEYPKMKFIVTGDALYATTSMIDICKEFKWNYIFNLKKKKLKNVYEKFEDNINYKNETTKKNYYLSNGIKFNGNILNVIRYEEYQNDKLVVFNYITDLKVNDHKIETIVAMGRRRWKIENEGFNEQKNGTFCISHLCSRNENALKIHYYLIQIAHIIRQLLDNGSILLRNMKFKTKKEVSAHLTLTLTNKHTNLTDLDLNFQLRFVN